MKLSLLFQAGPVTYWGAANGERYLPVPLPSEVRQLKVTAPQFVMHETNLLSSLCLLLVFQKRPWVVEGLVELHQWERVVMWDMGNP